MDKTGRAGTKPAVYESYFAQDGMKGLMSQK